MICNKLKNIKTRLSLPCWLEEQINSGKYTGLRWVERTRREFTVPWKHASRHGWLEDDAALFKAWAVYTRRFKEERGDRPDPKKWKANFRCAVNACPDITAVKKSAGTKRGQNAYRVFKFEKYRKSKKYVTPRNPGIKLIQEPLRKVSPSSLSMRRTSARSANRLKIKTEEALDCETAFTPQMSIKKEETTAFAPSFQELAKMIKQEDGARNDCCREISSGEVAIKDIKLEHIDWPPQITVKDMLQLPKPNDIGVNEFDCFTQQLQYKQQQQYNNNTYFNQDTYTDNKLENYHTQYEDLKTAMGLQSNVACKEENESTSANEMFAFLVEYMHEMVNEGPQQLSQGSVDGNIYDDFYNSGSDDESMIGPCRLGSVSSSLSNEDLEKMLSLPQSSTCEVHYEDMDCQPSLNSVNSFNFISTYTDPFLNSNTNESKNLDIQAFTEALKTELNVPAY